MPRLIRHLPGRSPGSFFFVWRKAKYAFTLYLKVLSMTKRLFSFHTGYFLLALLLLAVEIVIAKYAHDEFIRPFGGDYLVVILLYCLVRSVAEVSVPVAAISVLFFSYAVEISQYFHLADRIGYSKPSLIRTLLGSSFSWWDLLAYTLGAGTVIAWENIKRRSYGRIRS